MILTHPKAIDPFAPNPEGADCSYRQKESAIEIAIRKENVEYFKEMLKHSKVRSKSFSIFLLNFIA